MGMGMNSGGPAMSEINVTPLVDVMLVLLIIFMITAPLLNNSGVAIDLPKEVAPPLDEAQEDQLILELDAELRLYLNETQYTLEELQPKLKALAEVRPDAPVFLRADGSVAYKEVAAILALAKRSGMPRVGLVFDPSSVEEPKRR
jgi:biopolymer transport protein TolR